jgi:Fuc2NAc and GlcNAc transferase
LAGLLAGISLETTEVELTVGPVIVVIALTLLSSAVLTFAVLKLALTHGLLDVPNSRSSHVAPTARGGGAAIMLSATAGFVGLSMLRVVPFDLLSALLVGGGAVALVGFVDDRRPLPAQVRLAVHVAAALWAVFWLGGLPPLSLGATVVHLGWTGDALAVLGIVWTLNLFNFMDGIDGIAASEAVFVCAAAASLMLGAALSADVPAAGLVFAAACGGFLPWNWPRARIFMGDVGSGYIGYIIAVLAMAACRNSPQTLWVWLILGGAFFVDATVTLGRRMLRGERLYEAHRSHAYQWLARRWGGHRPVTLVFIGVNVLWLLPAAWFAMRHPELAVWLLVGSFIPLIVAVMRAGAGRAERSAD